MTIDRDVIREVVDELLAEETRWALRNERLSMLFHRAAVALLEQSRAPEEEKETKG